MRPRLIYNRPFATNAASWRCGSMAHWSSRLYLSWSRSRWVRRSGHSPGYFGAGGHWTWGRILIGLPVYSDERGENMAQIEKRIVVTDSIERIFNYVAETMVTSEIWPGLIGV